MTSGILSLISSPSAAILHSPFTFAALQNLLHYFKKYVQYGHAIQRLTCGTKNICHRSSPIFFFSNSSCMELKYVTTIASPTTSQTYKAFSKCSIPVTYKAHRQDVKHLDFQGMISSLSHIIWKSALHKTTVPCTLIKYFCKLNTNTQIKSPKNI